MQPSHTGTVLAGRYRVGHALGVGGTSVVYDGLDISVGRPIAVKILKDSRALARFEREARLLAKLAHPNIVAMSDFGNAPGQAPFIVMERLAGESHGTLLERARRIEAHHAARIALQVLSALDAAHAQGVVHRDIKPDNVFLCAVAGSEPIVKLVDFGIARPLEGATLEALTQAGGLLGTVSFMAPEQVLGAPVGPRTDLYALGATMYRMLEGRAPFAGSAVEVLTAIATRAPAPVRNADPTLAAIVARAMERDASARFVSARQMGEALQAYLATPVPAPTPARSERSLGVWIFASTLLFVVGTVAIAAFVYARSSAREAPIVADGGMTPEPANVQPEPLATSTTTAAAKPTTATATTRASANDTLWALSNVVVTTDALVVSGAVSESAVRRDLEWDAYDHRLCYGKAYDATNTPSGSVTVAFDIDDDLPRRAHLVASDFKNPAFELCVVKSITGMIFSHANHAGGAVTYRMMFHVK